MEITINIKAPEIVEALNNFTKAALTTHAEGVKLVEALSSAWAPALERALPTAEALASAMAPIKTMAPPPLVQIAPVAPVAPVAPLPFVEAPEAQYINPVPLIPLAEAPKYTLAELGKAGAQLAQTGKMMEAQALMQRYGITALSQLPEAQYGAFATELRALGAVI